MATLEQKSFDQGLHTEQLRGRTQEVFFSSEEGENFLYPYAYEVDLGNRSEFDAAEMEIPAINLKKVYQSPLCPLQKSHILV